MTLAQSTAAAALQQHDAQVYRTNANFVYSDAFTSWILSALDAKAGEKIVDMGCGSGELTVGLAQAVGHEGVILGIDSSNDMLEKAHVITKGLQNVSFLPAADIQELDVPAEHQHKYDAVFSNAVFHWCKKNPGGVLESIKKLLKPGGRIAVEMGGFMNMSGVRGAMHAALRRRGIDPVPLDPFYFPNPEQYSELLVKHGFTPISVENFPRPTKLPTDMRGWLVTFTRNSFLSTFNDEEAEAIMAEVVDEVRVDCMDYKGKWECTYYRLRIVATVA